jgi:hypothetical protein
MGKHNGKSRSQGGVKVGAALARRHRVSRQRCRGVVVCNSNMLLVLCTGSACALCLLDERCARLAATCRQLIKQASFVQELGA